MTSSLPEDIEHLNDKPLNEMIDAEDGIEESAPIDGDPEEPGKTETLGRASDSAEIDKWIGRGLKFPPVQDDGHW